MLPDFDEEFASPADHARFYRSIGMQVVPAYTHKETKNWKRPHLENWKQYTHDLSTQEQFDEWYGTAGRYSQRSNMGLITGVHPRRIIVVDLDTHKNPRAQIWWDGIHAEYNAGIVSECPTQRTGGGGYQMFFLAPEGWSCPTCKNSELGVDIRGTGGFAMLPPSKHESGGSYHWVEDKEPWNIELEVMPQWMCQEIDALSTNVLDTYTGERVRTSTPEYVTNEWGKKLDGREDRMKSLVFKHVIYLYKECPFVDPENEKKAKNECFEEYVNDVESRLKYNGESKEELLEKEGRGRTLFEQKWRATMRQWDTKISIEAQKSLEPEKLDCDDYRSIEDIKILPPPDSETIALPESPIVKSHNPNLYKLWTMDEMEAMPPAVELLEDIIAEDTFGFIYGAPGCGKTFIAMSLGLSIAYGKSLWFWGKALKKSGPVIYISNEGFNVMWNRMKAWKMENGISLNDDKFRMLSDTVNLTKKENVDKLMATIKDHIATMGQEPVAIFIDTVSRSIAGSDENLAKEMTVFVEVCDTIKRLFKTNIIGVHHTGRVGTTMRGSSSLDGAADYLLLVERDKKDGNLFGQIVATKIKAFEDGWTKHFELKKRVLTIDGKGSLVAVGIDDPNATQNASAAVSDDFGGHQETGSTFIGKKLPDHVVKAIFDLAQADWDAKRPWSEMYQAKSRYGATRIFGVVKDYMPNSNFSESDARFVFEYLTCKDFLVPEDYTHNKMNKTGLKVNKRPNTNA